MPTLKGELDPLRYYSHDGQRVPSVTSVLREGVPKPGLVKWGANIIAEAASTERERLATMKKAEVKTYLSALADTVRDTASIQGRIVHSAAEAIAKGLPQPEAQTDVEVQIVSHFQRFIMDFKPVFLESEAQIWNHRYGYAGTLDACANMIALNSGPVILDWKTSKSVWPEVALQLAAYARGEYILRADGTKSELPDIDMRRGYVLHLRPEGYKLHPVDISDHVFDVFLSALDIFHFATDGSKYVVGGAIEVPNA